MKTLVKLGLGVAIALSATASQALEEVPAFGANPGKLSMYRYAPQGMPSPAPLVVVLHGCTQTANDIASAGWNAVADAMKLYVVYPQQPSANNPAQCFDWFGGYNNPSDKTNITRGGGEDASVKAMVDKMKADYPIDAKRVFVVGFSAGAAMAAVMLATYPDVFAAGGINAGVPYDCPSTQNADVFTCMNPGKTMTADAWATLVKNAYAGWGGPWPRVTVWQGTSDTTVATQNSTELVKQWTAVHGVADTPTSQDTVDSYPRMRFADGSGHVMVEEVAITGMGHGYAIDAAHDCGTTGAYAPDEHVCTAKRMAEFFLEDPGATAGGDAGSGGGGSGGNGSGGASGGGNEPAGGLSADGGACEETPSSYTTTASHACAIGHARAGESVWGGVMLGLALVLRRRRCRAR